MSKNQDNEDQIKKNKYMIDWDGMMKLKTNN
jgi:hypothetical protein